MTPSKPCSTCRGIGFTWKHIGGWNLEIKDDPAFQYHPVQVPCSCQPKSEKGKEIEMTTTGGDELHYVQICSCGVPCPVHPNPERSEGKETGEKCGICGAVWGSGDCKDEIHEAYANGYGMGMKAPTCSLIHPTPSRAEGWEDEFDKEFPDYRAPQSKPYKAVDTDALKSFIRQLLLSSRHSAIEECEKAVEKRKRNTGMKGSASQLIDIEVDQILSALRLLREESEDKKDGV